MTTLINTLLFISPTTENQLQPLLLKNHTDSSSHEVSIFSSLNPSERPSASHDIGMKTILRGRKNLFLI